MNRIFVAGDPHGNVINRLCSKNFPEGGDLTKDDYVIILGDFGVIWEEIPDAKERYQLYWLKERPWTTLVVGGNHENWNRLRKTLTGDDGYDEDVKQTVGKLFKSSEIDDASTKLLGSIGPSVYFIPNGSIFSIGDKRIFCMGGAMSTDRGGLDTNVRYPEEDISWWRGEIPTHEEMNTAIDNLDGVNWVVDTVVSHTMPSNSVGYFNSIHGYHYDRQSDPTARHLQFIADNLDKSVETSWYCGHFHQDEVYPDVKNDINVRVCYKKVIEITND